MSVLVPLTVAVPLLAAPVVSLAGMVLPRRGCDVFLVATAVAATVLCALVLADVGSGLTVHWFGGWHPRGHGVAVGIDFAVDSFGAALATFVAALTALAGLYTTRAIGEDQPHYHALLLVFLAGMIGFAESGDLFNLFVFFELMSVAAFALVGYLSERRAAIEGALNFAVVNTAGTFLFLTGIALVYGRSGALNLAQIGEALAHHSADPLVVAAFGLICAALLIKAGAVPFHFWMGDAYAVAPAAVCLLLAGAMSELGLFGIGRVWFTAFQPVLGPHEGVIRALLVAVGLLTAIWGGAMALAEDHLKRMLAFVTISYVGIFLTGIALFTADGAAAAGLYALADGCGKAGLFACIGIIQHRTGHVGQARLHGRLRSLRGLALIWFALALVTAALPPFGSFLGKSLLDDAALREGYWFLPGLVALATAMNSGALLRAGGRIFFGWGQPGSDQETDDASEISGGGDDRTPWVMSAVAVALLCGAAALGVWYGLADVVLAAATRFADTVAYASAVLHGTEGALPPSSSHSPEWFDYIYGGGATVGALGIATLGLWGGDRTRRIARAGIHPVQALHTGRVGDYLAFAIFGAGVLAAVMLVSL